MVLAGGLLQCREADLDGTDMSLTTGHMKARVVVATMNQPM